MQQEGFAAFTYSHSQLKDVITYIENQATHHSTKTFKEEYLELLKRFDVSYHPKYVFDSDDTAGALVDLRINETLQTGAVS